MKQCSTDPECGFTVRRREFSKTVRRGSPLARKQQVQFVLRIPKPLQKALRFVSADTVASPQASDVVAGFDLCFVHRWERALFLLGTLHDQNSVKGVMDPTPLRFQAL
ncbi:hypothetical protein ASE04_28275 [Rhizobium sp. Root708]|nr:hypothetical protein ASE04_28275 [Rhizobium sp. Root708]